VIAISLAVVVVVCAVGFGLTLGADLDHRDQELTIGRNRCMPAFVSAYAFRNLYLPNKCSLFLFISERIDE
jgi:hypothetical protein